MRAYDEEVNTRRPTTSTAGRVMPALLAAAVVSIVLGIVGMHALNTHGVMSDADHATMTSPMTGQGTGAHGDLAAGTSDLGGVAGAVAAPPVGDNGHHPGSMVMLCVAILAAVAGALLLLLLGLLRIPRVRAHLLATPVALHRWATARLGTGPPPVWEFSVIRC